MLTLQEILSTTEGLNLEKKLGMNNLYEEYYILRFCMCVHIRVCALTSLCGSEICTGNGIQVYVSIQLL